MKKASLLIGLAAILTFGVFVYAARNSSTLPTPDLSVEGGAVVEEAKNEAWAQDPRSRASTTEGLEDFLPKVKEEVKQTDSPGFGDLVDQWGWSELGIPSYQYGGAGAGYVEGSDGNPYLLLVHQGYYSMSAAGLYILDPTADPPALVDIIPRAQLGGSYQQPWGLAVDNDKDIWIADLEWNVLDWIYEYAPEPPGHPALTGEDFNHSQGYAFMADGTDGAPGDTIWIVHVGDDNHVFGFQEPSGSDVRNFGNSTWDYISQRGLAWNSDDGSMHISSWNVSTCWEISPLDGTPIPGRSFSTSGCAGLAYQPEANGGPYIYVQENSYYNYLKKYHCPPLLPDDISMNRIVEPSFSILGAGEDLEIIVEVANVGTEDQTFDLFVEIEDDGGSVIHSSEILGLTLLAFETDEFAFPDMWTVPDEIGAEYTLTTWVDNPGDGNPDNDSLSGTYTVGPPCDEYHYDDGTEGNAFYIGANYYTLATMFVGTSAPAGLVWGAINTCSPGDRFWPWPDASLDPIEIGVWSSSLSNPSLPEASPVWADTLAPPVSPTWIVFMPPLTKGLSNSERIWIGYRNHLYPSGREGLMVDNVRDYYGPNFYGYYGNWYVYNAYGDWHMRGCLWYPPGLEWIEDELIHAVHPPDPWIEPLITEIPGHVWGFKENMNVTFWCDGLECDGRWLTDIDFMPCIIPLLPKGDTAEVVARVTVPIGMHAGTYEGCFWVMNDVGDTDSVLVSLTISSTCDLDVDDDYGNLSANTMLLRGNKPSGSPAVWYGTYAIACPGMQDESNPDFWDGPGALDLDAVRYGVEHSFFVDPDVVGISSLAHGHTRTNVLQVTVPAQGTGSHKMFGGTVTVTGYNTPDRCESEDDFTLLVQLDPPGHWPDNLGGKGGKFVVEAKASGNSVSWSSAGLGEVGYNVYRCGSTPSFVKLNSSPLEELSYCDNNVEAGAPYQYKLGLVFEDGEEVLLGPLSVTTRIMPRVFSVSQNFPNPVNKETVIQYAVASNAKVALRVYDIAGRVVETLVDAEQAPGIYSVAWNSEDAAKGVYFYRLTAGDFSQTRKMVVVK